MIRSDRYERKNDISNNISKTESTTNDGKTNVTDPIITFRRLKEMTSHMLRCRSTLAQIQLLINNYKNHYAKRKKVICKIILMIDLNTRGWTEEDRHTFLRWYYQQLQHISQQLIINRAQTNGEKINVNIH